MKKYNLINNVSGWIVFIISAITYILTLEPTASFWDCGEFIASAYKLEIGHPPGNPIFMLTGRFFANFASDPSQVAFMINLMSALLSAATILLLFWTITHLCRKLFVEDDQKMSLSQSIIALGCGYVGSLVYAFSDTFWFSAVEGEVYAYSSFCTALVFWLILKWEEVSEEPHADRYIVLIAYLIGVSIAVHLLNLLCIPAIVLVYYYKKYANANLKGSLIALLLSFAIIVLLLFGLVPGFIKVAGWMELFFVNTLGMPYNSGAIAYSIIFLAVISWAIYETVRHSSPQRIKISFIASVTLVGVPFIGDNIFIGILLICALSAYLFISKKVAVRTLNTILTCILVIFIGYSSYALIIIRSTANTPMDQNSPKDVFTLASYLNREQYGDRPLFYGNTFVSEVLRDGDGSPVSTKGAPIYRKVVKNNPNEKDKYSVIDYKRDYQYTPETCMLFPRMYSREGRHVEAYKEWTNFKGNPVRVASDGKTVMKPTFGENLKFFLEYQLNFMYWRYFMWNFSGRQNDQQGLGEVQNGNWITGFNFIDKFIAGDQSTLPDSMKNNKGRNVFFMLPLLLGLIGLLYQAYYGKKGIEQFWVVFFLFFMTGIAIVIYLNQTPYQPRERDYAYAGSFYAFTIWIGLGVAALASGLERILPKTEKMKTISAAVAVVVGLIVPIQMVSQTWDDHDRSGRTVARDFGMNYLSCVEPNGIIFTNGDNDTFPLWYAQEVEGYRTDVRVCNLSYLQTDWYVDQMKRPAYESAPLPISMTADKYSNGKRDYAYFIPKGTYDSLPLNVAMDYLLSDDDATKMLPQYGGRFDHFPTKNFYMPIDKEAVVKAGIIPDSLKDLIVPQMKFGFDNKGGLAKSEIAILDMLRTNAQEGWKRPIYYAVTVGNDMYMGLSKYFNLEGLAYRILPVETNGQMMNSDKMYDNMMNKFKWGGIDNPNVYLDENTRRMCRTQRMMFLTLIDQLIAEGKNDKALKAVEYSLSKIPGTAAEHNYISTGYGRAYFELGQDKKAIEFLNKIADSSLENLRWFVALNPNQLRTAMSDVSENYQALKDIIEIYTSYGKADLAKKYSDQFNKLDFSKMR